MPNTYCVLCGNRDRSYIYFSFPKDEVTRKKWLAFCGFGEHVLNTATKLCSGHFDKDDFISKRNYTTVKPNVVPSVIKKKKKLEERPSLQQNGQPYNLEEPVERGSANDISVNDVNANLSNGTVWNEMVTARTIQDGMDADLDEQTARTENFEFVRVDEDPNVFSKETCATVTRPLTPLNCGSTQSPQAHNLRYAGDIRTPHLATPRRAKTALQFAKRIIVQQQRKLKNLQQNQNRLIARVTALKAIVKCVKKEKQMWKMTAENAMAKLPGIMRQIFEVKNGRGRMYSAEVRAFILTLNFYSPKAYTYVRQICSNRLPHISTIRKWYSVLQGQPGFTKEVFHALTAQVSNTKTPIFCNLVIDEMAIRQQIIYDGKRYCGYVDLGMDTDTTNSKPAKNALVFMLVALNGYWKVPVGYFLINSLDGKQRANLLKICLELIYDTGVILHSLTFDGAHVNLSMCTNMGANFALGSDFKPYILHPVTKEKIFCFFDACHMLKLVRNTLGDKQHLKYREKDILWSNIVNLQKVQHSEGLRCGTKLTKKHIMYENARMNVKLAAQVLSDSVSVALNMCKEYFPEQFIEPQETGVFCSKFNNAFDLLNVRSQFSKLRKCNVALKNNFYELKNYADDVIEYITNLTTAEGVPILQSNRKMGFLGFIINLTNMFNLFNILKEKGLQYLLTYKLLQDHLESFFSAIRSRGGYNNNPNSKQFQSSYKSLIVRHEIEASRRGNCLISDIQVLFVSSAKSSCTNDFFAVDTVEDNSADQIFDHDYLATLWTLSPYVEDVVKYISGFVVKKLLGKICNVCCNFLTAESTDSTFINLKNRGKLTIASKDVIAIARSCETRIREHDRIILTEKNITNILCHKIFKSVCGSVFNSVDMTNHIMEQDLLYNHKTELIKNIIIIYVKLRLYHKGRCATSDEQKEYVRHKFTKLIHFKHQ